jgi:hypothetical protein
MSPFRKFFLNPEVLSGNVLRQLSQDGFSVLDAAFGSATANNVLGEIQSLKKSSQLHLNQTQFVQKDGSVELMAKPGIWEASSEVLSEKTWKTAPRQDQHLTDPCPSTGTLDALLVEAPGFLRQLLQDVVFPEELSSRKPPRDEGWRSTLKIQANDGLGGCFPMHFDTAPGVDSRVVTAIYYVNDQWKPGDGGELVLLPFPYASPPPIAPIADRLVLFSSRHMLHYVLPSLAPRHCITFWTYADASVVKQGRPLKPARASPEGTPPSSPGGLDTNGGALPLDEAVALSLLLRPQLRHHFARLALAKEWAASVVSSHAPSPQREMALLRHAEEVAAIESSLVKFLVESGLSGRAADPLSLAATHIPVDQSTHPDLVSWF